MPVVPCRGGPALLPAVRARQSRALGVSTLERIKAAPELPAIAETLPGTPEQFATFIRAELQRWGRLIHRAGLHTD